MLMPKLIVAKGDELGLYWVKGMALRGADSANGSRVLLHSARRNTVGY